MKLISNLIKVIILIFFITGCGNQQDALENEGYTFNYLDKVIKVGVEYNENIIGTPNSVFENENCAFSEKDMTYIYNNFQLQSYENDKGKMIIYSIFLIDNQVATKEGLSLYDTYDDMIRIYGNDYQNEGNLYIYTKKETDLNIVIQNGIIESIEYTLNNIK